MTDTTPESSTTSPASPSPVETSPMPQVPPTPPQFPNESQSLPPLPPLPPIEPSQPSPPLASTPPSGSSTALLWIALAVVVVIFIATAGFFYLSKTSQPSIGTPTPTPKVIISPTTLPSPSPTKEATTSSSLRDTESGLFGIEVTSPKREATISSPLTVSGRANVFEGHVNIRVKDSTGKVVGSGFGTACMGEKPCPFSAKITFTSPTASQGAVEAYTEDAANGSEKDLVRVPVRFGSKK